MSIEGKMGIGHDQATPHAIIGSPWFWLVTLAVLSYVRFVVAANHPLFETECYYWMYGQNVGFGYFDHPPMLGFFVHLFHFWEPPSSLAARFHAVVSHFFCSIFLYYYGRNLFHSTQAGIRTAILFNIVPIYSILAIQNQPDSPLLFFWCATLLCFERSVSTGKGLWWILVGMTAGGALLSKFHAVPLLGSLLLHLLCFEKDRKHLLSPWPYLAGAIAISCYFPNFWWNARNDWITYGFQFDRLADQGEFKVIHVIGVFLAPLLLLSPWIYGLLSVVAVRILKRLRVSDHRGWALCFWSSFPLFAFFVFISLSDSVKVHWTAPVFIGMLPAVAVALADWQSSRRLAFFGSAAGVTAMVYLYLVSPYLISHTLPNSLLPANLQAMLDERLDRSWASQNHGFDELGSFLQSEIAEEDPVDFDLIASWRFDRVSVAAFYSGEPDRAFVPTYGDRRGFEIWKSPHVKPGANALYVAREQSSESRRKREYRQLDDHFEAVGDPIVVEAPLDGYPSRTFLVYPCFGLKDENLVRLAKRD